jgi:hypothetical protein
MSDAIEEGGPRLFRGQYHVVSVQGIVISVESKQSDGMTTR